MFPKHLHPHACSHPQQEKRPPSEAVKTPRTCRLRMIMQLFALRLRLMEAKMTTLRFFDLLFSSRQTRFLPNTCRKRRVPWIFTHVAQTFEELERSGRGGGSVFGIFWCLFDALWVSAGLLFCMRSHFQAQESINHTVPFRSIALFQKKKGKFQWEISDWTPSGTAGESPMSRLERLPTVMKDGTLS